jgi:hypothetical protein
MDFLRSQPVKRSEAAQRSQLNPRSPDAQRTEAAQPPKVNPMPSICRGSHDNELQLRDVLGIGVVTRDPRLRRADLRQTLPHANVRRLVAEADQTAERIRD